MNKVLLLAITLLATQTFASPVLECSGTAFGIAKVVIDSSGTLSVTLSEDEEEVPTQYKIISGLKDVKNKTSATVIGQSMKMAQEPDGDTGGTVREGFLLRVLDGQKRAYLSLDGNVHRMNCY